MRGATLRDLLRGHVPEHVLSRIPRSFYIVGDIALIALDDDIAERYGSLVAEAIMRLQKNVRAVYAKGPRVGVERTCRLKHLGGERRTLTLHREYGVKILVDVEKTYFNPALGEEHRRIAEMTPPGSDVLDAFSGVGPFALHIACTKPSYVIAIDINAACVELMRKSISINRLRGFVEPMHGDSIRLFLEDPPTDSRFDEVIMNLPHQAHRYASEALKLLRIGGLLHVYVVARSPDEALRLAGVARGASLVEIRRVLDYAPRKYVYRATLRRV